MFYKANFAIETISLSWSSSLDPKVTLDTINTPDGPPHKWEKAKDYLG